MYFYYMRISFYVELLFYTYVCISAKKMATRYKTCFAKNNRQNDTNMFHLRGQVVSIFAVVFS